MEESMIDHLLVVAGLWVEKGWPVVMKDHQNTVLHVTAELFSILVEQIS